MKTLRVKLPELVLVAATRGLMGIGIGLLASTRLAPNRRRAVGRALLAVGVLSTIPLVSRIFGRPRVDPLKADSGLE